MSDSLVKFCLPVAALKLSWLLFRHQCRASRSISPTFILSAGEDYAVSCCLINSQMYPLEWKQPRVAEHHVDALSTVHPRPPWDPGWEGVLGLPLRERAVCWVNYRSQQAMLILSGAKKEKMRRKWHEGGLIIGNFASVSWKATWRWGREYWGRETGWVREKTGKIKASHVCRYANSRRPRASLPRSYKNNFVKMHLLSPAESSSPYLASTLKSQSQKPGKFR